MSFGRKYLHLQPTLALQAVQPVELPTTICEKQMMPRLPVQEGSESTSLQKYQFVIVCAFGCSGPTISTM